MKIIVGLGNPGPRYETTRHNVGFLAIDHLVDLWKATGPEKKYNAVIHHASVAGEKVLLVKPQTFMNLSGQSVGPAFGFFKCEPTDLIVIQDEIDLPFLQLRIKAGGGAGGHNGIKSIDQSVGQKNSGYYRIRVGVGRPSQEQARQGLKPSDYVLQPFTQEEFSQLDEMFDDIGRASEFLINNQFKEAMNRFNRRPPKKEEPEKEE